MTALSHETTAIGTAQGWLDEFSHALTEGAREELLELFQAEAGWRDLVAFTWNLRQAHDREAIADLILPLVSEIAPSDFQLDDSKPKPTITGGENGAPTEVEVFFRFKVAAGEADGMVYLVSDQDEPTRFRARTLMTRLTGLDAVPAVWPPEKRFDLEVPDKRWTEHRKDVESFSDRDPEVLIVGGGQWGVSTAAHLGRLGVQALIIDKQPNVGDGWRSRYEALLLHQPINMLHYSLMPFPESFPNYLPKDKVADWVQIYTSAFDLNFWTGTEFLGGSYDDAAGAWNVSVRRSDGSERTMRPRHVIMATGGSNEPNIPEIAGLEDFAGEMLHASRYRDAENYRGKKVLVVGTGTSAHDIALDIAKNGGDSTMLQRGAMVVINVGTAEMLYGAYKDRSTPVEVTDARFLTGGVFHQQQAGFIGFQQNVVKPTDRELSDGLQKAGMKLSDGQDGAGFYYHYLHGDKGGYYLNVGASDAIVRGDIKVLHTCDLESFDKEGIILNDGDRKQFDAVILATSNKPLSHSLAKFFGTEFVEKLGPIWGFGTDGEVRNVNKPTAQEGFWIADGSIPMARWHSPLIALMIAADLKDVLPAEFKTADHISHTPSQVLPALEGAVRIAR